MPSRTYTGVDMLNYVYDDSNTSHSSANGSSSAVLTPVSQFVVTGVGSASDAQNPSACSFNSTLQVFLSGDFPYNDPTIGIPEGVTITRLTINVQGNGTANVNVSSSVGTVTASCTALLSVEFPIGSGINPPDQGYSDGGAAFNAASPQSFSANGSSPGSFEIDLLPGITKAQLIADWGDIFINIGSACVGASDGLTDGGSGGGAAAFSLNNFSLIVDYTDPAIQITLTPSGGPVEPGQTIDVDEPDPDLTYAATNDPKIIPLPKKPGDPPKLTVPLPPTEECEDCIAECPECDTCYDACMEDLESENCQECLNGCLDCLEACLEDLEEAEKCQQSTQEPPEIPTTIIVCDPRGTRFTGSVPIGNFTIVIARASGIYRLVDEKANDTLYATARDGSTYDVAIPTPFGKTGFFRSN